MDAGDIIGGRYRLQRHIGEGGQASVWQALDETLDRPVAVKFIYARDERNRDSMVEEFLREAKISAAVQHRNVVQILDFGTHAGTLPFMVIELLEGESLAERLDRGPLTIRETVEIAVRTLEGLAAVHEAGIVHRDLKPENIFLVRDRIGVYPKLLDFGISKILDPTGTRRSAVTTQIGLVIGTPEYMSPEQARGVRDVDQRADLYALGIVMYECIVGSVPYESENDADLLVMVIEGNAPALVDVVPDVGPALSAAVMKAIHRRREDRFPDALAMREALVAAANDSVDGFSGDSLALTRGEPSQRRELPTRRFLRAGDATGDGDGAATTEQAGALHPDAQGGQAGRAMSSGARTLSELESTGAGRRPGWLLPVASAALLLAAIGLALALSAGDRPSADPRYIVVRGSDTPDADKRAASANPAEQFAKPAPEPAGASEAGTGAPAPAAASAPSALAASEPAAKPARAPVDQVTSLTRAFTRQKARVARCLEQHADQMGSATQLSVRIALDAGGKVQDASVAPEALASGPAGSCIASAVRQMRFGKQPAPVAFRVPLTARRGN